MRAIRDIPRSLPVRGKRCERNAHVLTRPPPVRQDAPITSQKVLVGRAQSEVVWLPRFERIDSKGKAHDKTVLLDAGNGNLPGHMPKW